ncbi:unnamed protein product [Microthlaspi erraticum]|uniref:Uncharacterized protein n=1 Tax=Microthlaspi erraticum TaxID=1685480 RepID=A0A6D2J891_9BRAS|nr:unnamed protein product [Microthlaspi erraticum]
MKTMLQQLIKGQTSGATELNTKLAEINNNNRKPKEYVQAITLKSGRVLPERVVPSRSNEDVAIQEEEESVDIEAEERVEKVSGTRTWKQRDSSRTIKGKKEEGNSFCSPPFKPMLPFPTRFKKQMAEKCRKVLISKLSEINLKIPFVDALMMIKPYQKFLKDAILERTKEVQGMVVLSQECSAIIQSKTVTKKLGDPGSFTLPVPRDH